MQKQGKARLVADGHGFLGLQHAWPGLEGLHYWRHTASLTLPNTQALYTCRMKLWMGVRHSGHSAVPPPPAAAACSRSRRVQARHRHLRYCSGVAWLICSLKRHDLVQCFRHICLHMHRSAACDQLLPMNTLTGGRRVPGSFHALLTGTSHRCRPPRCRRHHRCGRGRVPAA